MAKMQRIQKAAALGVEDPSPTSSFGGAACAGGRAVCGCFGTSDRICSHLERGEGGTDDARLADDLAAHVSAAPASAADSNPLITRWVLPVTVNGVQKRVLEADLGRLLRVRGPHFASHSSGTYPSRVLATHAAHPRAARRRTDDGHGAALRSRGAEAPPSGA